MKRPQRFIPLRPFELQWVASALQLRVESVRGSAV